MHEVGGGAGEIEPAGFLLNFGSRAQIIVLNLRNAGRGAGRDGLHRAARQGGPSRFQLVVEAAEIIFGRDGYPVLKNQVAGVNLVPQEEGGNPGFGIAVHQGPVDGGRAPVLRQQRSMNVYRAQTWHVPYGLGQHAEGYYHLQISGVAFQLGLKLGRLQIGGLQHGQVVGLRCHLHRRGLQLTAAPRRPVGGRDHGHHLPTRPGQQAFEGGDSEIRGAHENQAQGSIHRTKKTPNPLTPHQHVEKLLQP